jgi:hypothetical protein
MLNKACCKACMTETWSEKDEVLWQDGLVQCRLVRMPRAVMIPLDKYKDDEKCPYYLEQTLSNTISENEKDYDLEILKVMGLL